MQVAVSLIFLLQVSHPTLRTGKPNEADAVIQFFTDHFTRVFESAEKEREAREEGRKDKRPARTVRIIFLSFERLMWAETNLLFCVAL